MEHVKRTVGLVSQRFDLVPSTLESALCLNVMLMLESSHYAMPCARCKLAISHNDSSRANHQRARAKRGQPVYHEECRQGKSPSAQETLLASQSKFREITRKREGTSPVQ